MLTIVVIAKECVPGRVKTRLTPQLSFAEAAQVAAASLADTLDAVSALPADRLILAFDGYTGDNAPAEARGFEVVPQSTGGLDERLAAIFDGCTGPTLLVGMDTPQLRRTHLEPLLDEWVKNTDAAPGRTQPGRPYGTLTNSGHAHPDRSGAWLGLATDGGFWALALAEPDGSLIRGVPMSRPDTGRLQLERLLAAGLRVRLLDELTDVDTADDAVLVAAEAPDGRFAAALAATDLFSVAA